MILYYTTMSITDSSLSQGYPAGSIPNVPSSTPTYPITTEYSSGYNMMYGTFLNGATSVKPGTYTLVDENDYKKLVSEHTEYKNKIAQLTQNEKNLKQIIRSKRQSINALKQNNKNTKKKLIKSTSVELEINDLKENVKTIMQNKTSDNNIEQEIKTLKEQMQQLMEHKESNIWIQPVV